MVFSDTVKDALQYKQDELACLWGEFTKTAAGLFDD